MCEYVGKHDKPTLHDLGLSGQGHDGYVYQADVYCVECGGDILADLADKGMLPATWDEANDTEKCPVPIFFGDSPDCAQHCANCGEYLYGSPTV